MLEYTEYQHAFISAMFYKKLKGLGDRGIAAFVLATQRYAEQRGSRMAQRAISLGMPLDFTSYFALGEWDFSEFFKKNIKGDHVTVDNYGKDYVFNICACAWHEQYKEMELIDGAHIYCAHLDVALARGFNPYLDFSVTQTMHVPGNDKCTFVLKEANVLGPVKKLSEWVMPFEYHCAHVYHTFREVTESIFCSEGTLIASEVIKEFSEAYGKESADRLIRYKDTNFNVLAK